jgi:hypothetical protein
VEIKKDSKQCAVEREKKEKSGYEGFKSSDFKKY